MKRTSLVVITIAILLSLGLLLNPLLNPQAVGAQPPTPQELPPQMPSAVRGQSIYEARCASCHGPQGAGDGEMTAQLPNEVPSFQDPERLREITPAEYFDIITNGNMENFMPPWGQELSAQQRWDVLFYVWSFTTTREDLETGEEIYTQECAECHGEAGDEVEAIDLSDQAAMAVRSPADLVAGIQDGHADVDWQDTLTDEERWDVADFVRTFTYEPVAAAEAASGDGVIEGQVINGTAGAQADPADIDLSVFPVVGQTTLTPITVSLQADGTFRVEDLPTDPDRGYGLQATYKGVDYFHPELIDLSETPSASVTVHVYETTEDDSAISVERDHVIIDFGDNRLQVAELYIFRNSGDRAFVGAGETLRFTLPEGAQNVRFDDPRMEGSAEVLENEVVDTLPVPPGSRQVLLSYSVPYEGASTTFQKEIVYPTQSLNVLIADEGVDVDAGGLVAGEPVTALQDRQFLNFTRDTVPAGGQLQLKLSNLPRGGAAVSVPPDRSNTLRWFGLGFVALALVFVMAYPAVRTRLVTEDVEGAQASETVLRRRRQMLLEELADLDDAYEAGEVPEGDYLDIRAEIKADLIDVMRELQRLEEASDAETSS